MGLPSGTQDPRQFRHFAKMAPNGTVAALVEIAEGAGEPQDTLGTLYVEVTALYPYDLSTARVILPALKPGVLRTDVQRVVAAALALVSTPKKGA